MDVRLQHPLETVFLKLCTYVRVRAREASWHASCCDLPVSMGRGVYLRENFKLWGVYLSQQIHIFLPYQCNRGKLLML